MAARQYLNRNMDRICVDSVVLLFMSVIILNTSHSSDIIHNGPLDLGRRQPSTCNQDEFECDDESCIPVNRACDWYLDCEDTSDEGEHCRYAGFECTSGTSMVSLEWLCDGIIDCEDGSDEDHQYCHVNAAIPKVCPHISCDNSTKCIQKHEICDGTRQCMDGLDESDDMCILGQGKCFSCDGGAKCLDWDWVCDEVADCSDMTDEFSDWCGTVFQRCWKGSFLCGHSHFCVPQRWRCDHHNDCGDQTDETQCASETQWTGSFEWSAWSSWSECHPSCGPGMRSRSRVCDSPAGLCEGEGLEEDACELAPCIEDMVIGCGIKEHLHLRDDGLGLAERIVGGQQSDQGDWPWQAQLFYRKRGRWMAVCGGTLINPQMVLSAAHCFMGSMNSPPRWQVQLGKHSINFEPETGSQLKLVREIVVHKDFSEHGSVTDDIAILILDSPVTQETGQINWACLDEGMPLNKNTECYISGWGVTEMGGDQGSRVLLEARVPIISRRDCNQKRSYNGIIEKTMLCAGHMEGGIDACRGDSGGPLSCIGPDDRWYVVGITSWGHGCAIANKPGVYTRVSEYHEWIQTIASLHL